MTIPEDVSSIIEPFVGRGDLLKFIKNKEKYSIEAFDVDPKYSPAIKRDTLVDPPSYNGKFVLTNPPYLARNKNLEKDIYDMYKTNDLYKCFITCLIKDICVGGILILPLNFLSSIRKSDINLRRMFLNIYKIDMMNVFEEQVFEHTNYTTCSILFSRGLDRSPIKTTVFPSKTELSLVLSENNNYTIGGEIYNQQLHPSIKVQRATKNNIENITNIILKCIDDVEPLGFKVVDDTDKYIDRTNNLSYRSYAVLLISKRLDIREQQGLVEKMNDYIKMNRTKYHSLFLSNYRENGRKRISFDLAFKIVRKFINN